MTRFVPFAVVAVAAAVVTLGACSTPPQTGGPAQPGANIVTNVHPYAAGNGTVQQVFAAPVAAGAGSSAEPMQRLEIKMDNGSVQYVFHGRHQSRIRDS